MNPKIPPTEALDEQERDLARIVRALPGGEPSAALDARILKAAGNAAAASRRPHARWIASTGALWGIGGAAAAVLALGVSWQLMYPSQPSMRPETAPAAKMSEQADDSTVSVELKDQLAAASADAPAPTRSNNLPQPRERQTMTQPGAPAAPPAPMTTAAMPEPFAGEHLDEHVPSSERAAGGADSPMPEAGLVGHAEQASEALQSAPAAKAMAESAKSQRAEVQSQLSRSDAANAAVTAGALDKAADVGKMKPSNWLAHIRQLRDQDRTAEARASLIEFHQRYPDFVIPSDLAPLLRE
jgi:hypothetical protein